MKQSGVENAEQKAKEIAEERIHKAVKTLANMINLNEGMMEELRWSCESQEWNNDVVYELEEAQMKLGQALATLTLWFEDEEE